MERVSDLLFALKHNGLVLVDPALILHLAFNHVVSLHGPDYSTDTAHVEEKILANEAVIESVDFVSHGYCHVSLRGDMSLICCHFEYVTLVEMNLLVFVRLAEEELRLLAKLHDHHDPRLVLLGRLTRPLH